MIGNLRHLDFSKSGTFVRMRVMCAAHAWHVSLSIGSQNTKPTNDRRRPKGENSARVFAGFGYSLRRQLANLRFVRCLNPQLLALVQLDVFAAFDDYRTDAECSPYTGPDGRADRSAR